MSKQLDRIEAKLSSLSYAQKLIFEDKYKGRYFKYNETTFGEDWLYYIRIDGFRDIETCIAFKISIEKYQDKIVSFYATTSDLCIKYGILKEEITQEEFENALKTNIEKI